MVDFPDFSKPVLSAETDNLIRADYTPTWLSYPVGEGYVTQAQTDKNSTVWWPAELSYAEHIPINYDEPTRLRIRSYNFLEDDHGEKSDWSEPITVNAPDYTTEWVNTGQILIDEPDPVQFSGYGDPTEDNTEGAVAGDIYTDLDTGLTYELGNVIVPTPYAGVPDAVASVTVVSNVDGIVRLEWPEPANANYYTIYQSYWDDVLEVYGSYDLVDQVYFPLYDVYVHVAGQLSFSILAGNANGDAAGFATTSEPVIVDTPTSLYPPNVLPGPPENFRVVSNEDGYITLAWDHCSDPSFAAPDRYDIYYSESPEFDPMLPFDPTSVDYPATTVTNPYPLSPQTYGFYLAAVNDASVSYVGLDEPVAMFSDDYRNPVTATETSGTLVAHVSDSDSAAGTEQPTTIT